MFIQVASHNRRAYAASLAQSVFIAAVGQLYSVQSLDLQKVILPYERPLRGAVLGLLGAILGCLGAILGRPGAILGVSLKHLGNGWPSGVQKPGLAWIWARIFKVQGLAWGAS